MTNGQQATGTRDETYNLVSVLYHALQAAETYQQYIDDAQGDEELAGFFRDLQEQDRQRGERAKKLLATRIGSQA